MCHIFSQIYFILFLKLVAAKGKGKVVPVLWEELIAYFPSIQHGPHRKQNNCVDTHRQQGDLIIYTRRCGDFYRTVA
jgi:hypothetical protein